MDHKAAPVSFDRVDARIFGAIVGIAGLIYLPLAWRLSQGLFLDYWNLAFDFDPEKFVAAYAGDFNYRGEFRHALIMLLYPFGFVLREAGLGAKGAAAILTGVLGALRPGLIYLCVRALGGTRAISAAMAVLFAVSGVQIILAIVVESYGPAMDALLLGWLLIFLRQGGATLRPGSTIGAGVANVGITLSNISQLGLAHMAQEIAQFGVRRGLVRTVVWSATIVLVAGILAVPIWYDVWLGVLTHPVQTLKEIYWASFFAGPKTGASGITGIFTIMAAVSPAYSFIDIPGGISMWDFRELIYTRLGWATVGVWLGLLGAGIWMWLRRPGWRMIGLLLLASFSFNVLMHTSFQFRNSIYIYAGHSYVPLFLLAAGAVVGVRGWKLPAAICLLAAMMAMVNFPPALQLVTGFDSVNVSCTAPCL